MNPQDMTELCTKLNRDEITMDEFHQAMLTGEPAVSSGKAARRSLAAMGSVDSKGRRGKRFGVWLIAAAVVLGIIAYCGIKTGGFRFSFADYAAVGQCKEAAAKQMNDPDSVKFKEIKLGMSDKERGDYLITGSALAKNAFGSFVPRGFICTINGDNVHVVIKKD
ncbi:MAG: hypothetical protein ACRCWS_06500 [Propionibacteriaceae bacterium]